MTINPPPEFYYFAGAYFHQDFHYEYDSLDELAAAAGEHFRAIGRSEILKKCLRDLADQLTDDELEDLWKQTGAAYQLVEGELRQVFKFVADTL